jgi:hypothetical protein
MGSLIIKLAAAGGVLGVLALAAASAIGSQSTTNATSPHPYPTPNITAIQASAIKAVDSTIKYGVKYITWKMTSIAPGTYGSFVATAPSNYKNVPVFEVTLQGSATIPQCSAAQAPCASKTYHATEKAVVTQFGYQTLWVSGTKTPI